MRVCLDLVAAVAILVGGCTAAVEAFTVPSSSGAVGGTLQRQHPSSSSNVAVSSRRLLRPFAFSPPTSLYASTASTPTIIEIDPDVRVATRKVETDADVMEVASFRNNLESPEMMIARQKSKRDDVDNTAEALKGVGIGFGIGFAAAALAYSSSGSVEEALQQFGIIGGMTGTLLGVNNYLGKSVYVMDVPEAYNRLKVDFAEGLMARQDVGFVARLVDDEDGDAAAAASAVESVYGGRYAGTNGVVGCVDCQLRNCDTSPNARRYGNLPPHVHIKNVMVDEKMRRRGIAKALVRDVEEYAKTTEAELITLAVDNDNVAAVNLYSDFGYDSEDIGNPMAQQKYGQWTRGRSMMTKFI